MKKIHCLVVIMVWITIVGFQLSYSSQASTSLPSELLEKLVEERSNKILEPTFNKILGNDLVKLIAQISSDSTTSENRQQLCLQLKKILFERLNQTEASGETSVTLHAAEVSAIQFKQELERLMTKLVECQGTRRAYVHLLKAIDDTYRRSGNHNGYHQHNLDGAFDDAANLLFSELNWGELVTYRYGFLPMPFGSICWSGPIEQFVQSQGGYVHLEYAGYINLETISGSWVKVLNDIESTLTGEYVMKNGGYGGLWHENPIYGPLVKETFLVCEAETYCLIEICSLLKKHCKTPCMGQDFKKVHKEIKEAWFKKRPEMNSDFEAKIKSIGKQYFYLSPLFSTYANS
jgi:hypothetical protein